MTYMETDTKERKQLSMSKPMPLDRKGEGREDSQENRTPYNQQVLTLRACAVAGAGHAEREVSAPDRGVHEILEVLAILFCARIGTGNLLRIAHIFSQSAVSERCTST